MTSQKGMRKCDFLINKKEPFKTVLLAGVEGIEPSSGVLETLILPMNYTPKVYGDLTRHIVIS